MLIKYSKHGISKIRGLLIITNFKIYYMILVIYLILGI